MAKQKIKITKEDKEQIVIEYFIATKKHLEKKLKCKIMYNIDSIKLIK